MKQFEYAQAVVVQGQEPAFLTHRGLEGWELVTMLNVGMTDDKAHLNGRGKIIGVKQQMQPGWLMIFKREIVNAPDVVQLAHAALPGE